MSTSTYNNEFPQTQLGRFLREYDACPEAILWCKAGGLTTLAQAWAESPCPEYLLWALGETSYMDARVFRLFGCWCVQQVWQLLEDPRSRLAVEVSERYAQGLATSVELLQGHRGAQSAWESAKALSQASMENMESAPLRAMRSATESAMRLSGDHAECSAAASAAASAWESVAAWESADASKSADCAHWHRHSVWKAAWDRARLSQADKLRDLIPWNRIVAHLEDSRR